MSRPQTRFAWNGAVALAYQVIGEGPVDLVYVQGWASNVEANWDMPEIARWIRDLSEGVRLIVVDRRGYGCSDSSGPSDVAPLEVMAEDLLAVMDAAGSDRAVLFAWQETVFTVHELPCGPGLGRGSRASSGRRRCRQ
jgi:pimeloyl-ACP methyl ester carboxylesterase